MGDIAHSSNAVKCVICDAQARGLEDGFCRRAKHFVPSADANAAYLFAYKRGLAARKRVDAAVRHSGPCGGSQ